VMELRGEGVVLRPFRADEIEPVLESARRWLTERKDDAALRAGTRQRIEGSGAMTDRGIDFAIEVDGRLVGDVQARRDMLPKGTFELGIALFDESDRGHGYGRTAVALLTRHLFDDEGAHRVQLSTDVTNAAMRGVVERLGFGFEGVLRGFWPEPDGPHDYAMYGITKDDYDEVREPWISTS
jgi:RimJ/RimL family protein N-acetyltransferase